MLTIWDLCCSDEYFHRASHLVAIATVPASSIVVGSMIDFSMTVLQLRIARRVEPTLFPGETKKQNLRFRRRRRSSRRFEKKEISPISIEEKDQRDKEMDQIFNKVGSYWIGQKTNKQFESVGKDVNSISTSIEGGTKWLVNKIKGKMQKPLPEFLKQYELPIGIFPEDATNYEFDEETKKLTVLIPTICEVGYKDSSVLKFTTVVTGHLEKGKLTDVEGIKTKVMIWVKVTTISADSSKVHFTAGMKKSRSRDAYEVLRKGVRVEKF